MTTSKIERHALMHINAAKLMSWTWEAAACDYAQCTLEAQGYDPDLAADAVAKVWRELQHA